MKLTCLFLSLFCFITSCIASGGETTKVPKNKINIKFASKVESQALLMVEDSYTRNWSQFDIASRLQNPKGTKEDLLQLMANESLDWTNAEMQMIQTVVGSIEDSLEMRGCKLQFPHEITIVKSKMKTEQGAEGYTRGNWIAISDETCNRPIASVQRLLIHELFHILTRDNPKFREKIYASIGFTVLEDEIVFPEDILKVRISNPDVDRHDSYINLTVNGEPQKCYLLLYTEKEYTEGSFFEYWNVGFVPLDGNMKPVQKNGKTVIYSREEVSDFMTQVGENTNYVVNPEEILADNFAIAILNKENIRSPELKEKIQQMLRE